MNIVRWLVMSSTEASSRLFADLLPWLAALGVLAVAGGIVILLVRRAVYGRGSSSSAGFSLQELRDLHAAGKLTDEEFERAKAQMIGRLKPPAKPDPPGNSGNQHEQSSP